MDEILVQLYITQENQAYQAGFSTAHPTGGPLVLREKPAKK
jgi:hypothetical protein